MILASCIFTISAAVPLPPAKPTIKQVTSGPANHFYGYIGHVGNTPWNASGRYMAMLRVGFQDRMPGPDDPADVVILDTANDYTEQKIEETRAWNPQQGTMLYWDPQHPESRFFMNDRDPKTQKVFCVVYDVEQGRRVREYRFEDTPVGNSGVSRDGRYFLALNYGRMDRLRKVTGYGGAFDWTDGESAPKNDGVWKVEVLTGEKTLLVSFAELAEKIKDDQPWVVHSALFINHTLWSQDGERILFYARGNWDKPRGPMINVFFTMRADGTGLERHPVFPGGHPEWGEGHTLIGAARGRQVVYDVDEKRVVRELGGRRVFPDPEGDIALSPDGKWLVNGYPRFLKNEYVVYNMEDGSWFRLPGLERGFFWWSDVRLDPAPCWRPDGRAISAPGLAPDGTRQMFVMEF